MSRKENGKLQKDLKNYLIRKESRYMPKIEVEWVDRKVFREATKDRNCFGKTIEGAHPERMSNAEYDEWVKSLPKVIGRI